MVNGCNHFLKHNQFLIIKILEKMFFRLIPSQQTNNNAGEY